MSLVQAHRLRGYDAIQLAAALEIAAELAALGFSPPPNKVGGRGNTREA